MSQITGNEITTTTADLFSLDLLAPFTESGKGGAVTMHPRQWRDMTREMNKGDEAYWEKVKIGKRRCGPDSPMGWVGVYGPLKIFCNDDRHRDGHFVAVVSVDSNPKTAIAEIVTGAS